MAQLERVGPFFFGGYMFDLNKVTVVVMEQDEKQMLHRELEEAFIAICELDMEDCAFGMYSNDFIKEHHPKLHALWVVVGSF